MHNIEIENFQGPLDLLLKLIEKEELDISQISMANITDQYLGYIKNEELINPDDIGDFLVIAAKLLYIKSKLLLPYFSWNKDDDDSVDELKEQLKIYKEFLELSKGVEVLYNEKNTMYPLRIDKNKLLKFANNKGEFCPPKNLTTLKLSKIYRGILNDVQKREQRNKLDEEIVDCEQSINDKMIEIKRVLGKKLEIAFDKLVKNSDSQVDVVLSFLVILELNKQKIIILSQKELFAPINITQI